MQVVQLFNRERANYERFDELNRDHLDANMRSIFYYALASWRRKPFVPSGATGFSYHKKNGYAGILYTLARMSLVAERTCSYRRSASS